MKNKIDLVYLWVDGSDKKLQSKKNAALKRLGIVSQTSQTAARRWQDNQELRYSLRSVLKFAPWINHIFIVTDGQRPDWLKDDSKITIVDHSEIIPKKFLPTFNSRAIEFSIHNIPGLSEHFIYANDDMFLGAPVSPDFFFDANGNPIVIMKERNNSRAFHDKTSMGHWKNTKWNALKFVRDTFGLKYQISFKHAIEPIRKSYMAENAERFYDEIILPTMTQFRDKKNMQRMILPMIDNALGRNTIVLNWRSGHNRIVYDVRRPRLLAHFFKWFVATLFGFIKYDCYDKQWKIVHFIKRYKPKSFAINDTSNKRVNFDRARELMNEMFPKKSRFEI